MTKHLDTRVDKLSGGQRKRASVALELLTGPSLLILDEPTSGLDPALDRQVMTMLRQLADAGRVVLVVTHSLTYLDVCDQVLLLAPGGKTAFCGPPSQIGPELGTTNWADIFSSVAGDPEGAKRQVPRAPRPAAAAAADAETRRARLARAHQRAQTVLDDRATADAADHLRPRLLHLPGDPAVHHGRAVAVGARLRRLRRTRSRDQGDAAPNQPGQMLVLLNVGAIFMGTALTIRDLIGERAIFLREQAVGLSTTAYLLAKVCVYSVFAIVQSGIVTAITLIGDGLPKNGHQRRGDTQPVPRAVRRHGRCDRLRGDGRPRAVGAGEDQRADHAAAGVAVMSQLVFSGGLIPVTGRIVLDQMSWVTPARWGFAATASTVDLHPTGAAAHHARRTRTGSTPRARGCSTWPCWGRSASST